MLNGKTWDIYGFQGRILQPSSHSPRSRLLPPQPHLGLQQHQMGLGRLHIGDRGRLHHESASRQGMDVEDVPKETLQMMFLLMALFGEILGSSCHSQEKPVSSQQN